MKKFFTINLFSKNSALAKVNKAGTGNFSKFCFHSASNRKARIFVCFAFGEHGLLKFIFSVYANEEPQDIETHRTFLSIINFLPTIITIIIITIIIIIIIILSLLSQQSLEVMKVMKYQVGVRWGLNKRLIASWGPSALAGSLTSDGITIKNTVGDTTLHISTVFYEMLQINEFSQWGPELPVESVMVPKFLGAELL